MMISVIIDTNVFVAGLRSSGGASRLILRKALTSEIEPVFGNALWSEYQELLGRPAWGNLTTHEERLEVLAALAMRGRWTRVFYGWRPNLPDEGDNHLVELALASNVRTVITHNVRDLTRGELVFESLMIKTPEQFLKEI